jgi:hypothetical protein
MINSTAGLYNITCEQGATFKRSMTWTDPAKNPRNLTGYTARMQVRPAVDSNIVILSLTTENSRISIDGPAGTVNLHVDDATTNNLAAGLYVYDLEIISGDSSEVTRLVEGNFLVKAGVTR